MSITYKIEDTCKIPQLRGMTVTGGKLCRADHKWQGTPDAVMFAEIIDGRGIMLLIAGRPELEAHLAAHLAAKAAEQKARENAAAAHLATPRGQREALVIAEYNSYSPDHYPGSAAWLKNAAAINALDAFDAAHPDLVAELAAERAAKQRADYDALSDFVKNGS